MSRGKRESHWTVIRRCLAIIRRVQRGPTDWQGLLQAVLQGEGKEAYGMAEPGLLRRRLENDLMRIRQHLYVDLYYSRQENGYVIRSVWTPLLDLPDEDLQTIAWLREVFDLDSPYHDEVHALLDRLSLYLGPERAGFIENKRRMMELDLRQRDEDEIPPTTWEGLSRALAQGRWVEFDYVSPQQADGMPRRHRVAPQREYFDPSRGHYYLYGWCKHTIGPEGTTEPHTYFYYRLGRISNLRVLPDKMPPRLPRGPSYPVVYELSPKIARLGVTRHPEITYIEVEQREDGSALVRGETENLFFTVQRLLQYGPNCRVLGGTELLTEMRQALRKMAEIYRLEE